MLPESAIRLFWQLAIRPNEIQGVADARDGDSADDSQPPIADSEPVDSDGHKHHG